MLIGITGTIGAGKGVVVKYLIDKGFSHFSVRTFLSEELQKRNLEPIRDNYFAVANELRREFGSSYIIETLIARAKECGGHAIVESVRTLGEVESLQKENAMLLAVDAPIHVRYERILGRGHSTDMVSLQKFIEDEEKEYKGGEPWEQNLQACIESSHQVIYNDTSFEEIYAKLDTIVLPHI